MLVDCLVVRDQFEPRISCKNLTDLSDKTGLSGEYSLVYVVRFLSYDVFRQCLQIIGNNSVSARRGVAIYIRQG